MEQEIKIKDLNWRVNLNGNLRPCQRGSGSICGTLMEILCLKKIF